MKSHEKSLYGSTAVWLEIRLDQRCLSFKPFVAMEGETVLETPSRNKRGHENLPTPAPRAKRCRKSVVEAEQLASSAAKLESEAAEMQQNVVAAEKAALEAMERAQALSATAKAVASRAKVAKVMAQEARQKAERAELSTTKSGRDALKACLTL